MRRNHLDTLTPCCPVCRQDGGPEANLVLGRIEREVGEFVVEGVLHCPEPSCLREYPIVDGVPILLPAIREWVQNHLTGLILRDDLAESTESLIGDAVGPGTPLDADRQRLSAYGWDHYGDLDPGESSDNPSPGSVLRCLEAGLELLPGRWTGPVIDLGCSLGRTAFALAATSRDPVLGVDLDFPPLRAASRLLRTATIRYPRRRVGLVYDRREFLVRLPGAEWVDFWALDALATPLPSGIFGLVVALNILDCVTSPRDLIAEIRRLLRPGGMAIVSTPYDWSASATPPGAWIGGHSQRGPRAGASEPLLRDLLDSAGHPHAVSGLRVLGEITDLPWHVRMHARSTVSYRVHVLALEAVATKGEAVQEPGK